MVIGRLGGFLAAGLLLLTSTAAAQMAPAIQAAIEAGDIAALEAALESGADPNARQIDGLQATPLMWATSQSDPAFVDRLIRAGAEVDIRDTAGDPAINWAAYYGSDRVIARLLQAGAETELVGHGTPSAIAMRRGHQAALQVLLDHAGPDRARARWQSRLELAVQAGDAAAIAALAVDHDLREARDWAGRPILHYAARIGQSDSVTALLDAGVAVDAIDLIGFTALFEAAREGRLEAAARLLAAGASPAHRAEDIGLAMTPLHLAAIGGNADLVRAVIQHGADLDALDTTGGTALLWTSYEGQREAAAALIEAGADASIALEDGTRFTDIAAARGWTEFLTESE